MNGALRGESGRLSSYARSASDPGGENRIILFKSCFPNSNLEGAPTDPPRRSHGLTVGNAKAIYKELLTYFRTSPAPCSSPSRLRRFRTRPTAPTPAAAATT